MTIGVKLIVFKWPTLHMLRTLGLGSLIPNFNDVLILAFKPMHYP